MGWLCRFQDLLAQGHPGALQAISVLRQVSFRDPNVRRFGCLVKPNKEEVSQF
jgi:hypothetical protein